MTMFDSSDAHFAYMEVVSHWCPQSQRFAGGDALITYVDEGWEIGQEIFYEEFGQTGGRQIVVYYFELHKDNKIVRMPVIHNPYVERLVQTLGANVTPAAHVNRERRIQQSQLA